MSLRSEESCYKRLKESITTALYHGNDSLLIINEDNNESSYFSKSLICPSSGISYEKPEPNSFSFNSPKGMCKSCNGLGIENKVNINLIIPDNSISIYNGGIKPLGNYKKSWIFKQIETISNRYNFLDKYQLIGKLKRFYFRFRRAFWYFKRGNFINRLKQSYININ